MSKHLFTSEAVSKGHPDKIADQISDAILDASISQDPYSKVACETLVTDGLVVLAGEITSKSHFDPREVVIQTVKDIGYDRPSLGFDYNSCGILISFHQQSPDIAMGVNWEKQLGAGDQGMMFGFACDETKELMPLPITFAHKMLRQLETLRLDKSLPYLGPDAKSQVTVEYEGFIPKRIDTVVLSSQHTEDVNIDQVRKDLKELVIDIAPQGLIDKNTQFFINPTGRFVIGGPRGDTGLTGRKVMVDTYGGMGRHGGGAFSGKDPSKVDRTAAYMARYVAKNVVAAKLAKRCEVQISYSIGVAKPVAIYIDTFGTNTIPVQEIHDRIVKLFDFTPRGMIETLNLLRPIFRKTASGGHFGRDDPDFTWERLDKVSALQ